MEFKTREFFYLSNILSLSRIFIMVPMAYLIKINTASGNLVLFFLVLAGTATDFLDGYLSRKLNQVTDLGKILDPLADKIAMVVIFLALIFYRDFPISLAVFLVYRDVLIVVLGGILLRKNKTPVMANFLGKLNTTVVSFTCVLYMFNVENILLTISLISSYLLIFISGISYYRVGENLLFQNKTHKYLFRAAIFLMTALVFYFSWTLTNDAQILGIYPG